MRHRLHFGRSSRDAWRALLEGDLVFFEEDGGSGGDDDGSQGGGDGGGGGGGNDDGGGSQADDDGSQGGGGDDDTKNKAETVSGDEYRKKLAENKTLRDRAKKAEDELAELKKRDETEQQRRDRELEEQKKRSTELEVEAQRLRVQVLAPKAGILPEAAASAYALVKWDDVDVDDEKAVLTALKALKDDHRYLFESKNIGAGDKNHGDKDIPEDASPQQRLKQAYAGKT